MSHTVSGIVSLVSLYTWITKKWICFDVVYVNIGVGDNVEKMDVDQKEEPVATEKKRFTGFIIVKNTCWVDWMCSTREGHPCMLFKKNRND